MNKLSIEEFGVSLAEIMKSHLESLTGTEVEVSYTPKIKTNIKAHGVTIKESGADIAPSIDYDRQYSDYLNGNTTVESVAAELSSVYMDNRDSGIKKPEITLEEAKKHITLNVINAERNEDLLSNTPHFMVGDLAVIPRWQIDEHASFIVNNEITKHLGLTHDEVLQIGQDTINHSQFQVVPMENILAGMLGQDVPDTGGMMYVLTGSDISGCNGANVLLSQKSLDRARDELGSDIVILPSSRHELIALKITDVIKPDILRAMVKEVNAYTVSPEDFLSDNIYKYDGNGISVVGESFNPEVEQQTATQTRHYTMGGI